MNNTDDRAKRESCRPGSAPANFKCMHCDWVGAVNPKDPACGNSRCVEPYPGKGADGVAVGHAPSIAQALQLADDMATWCGRMGFDDAAVDVYKRKREELQACLTALASGVALPDGAKR